MTDYKQQWNRCLQLIRENIGKDTKMIPVDDSDWVFNTWFAAVTFESYDPETGALMLSVPDGHVCDYIEHYHMPLWSWALRSTFGQQVRLNFSGENIMLFSRENGRHIANGSMTL